MRKTFLVNILFLIFVNLLVKPFYLFGIDRTVQNTVADGEYGLYFALFNFTFLFQIINDFGIQSFNNRNIAQYNQLLDKYFPNVLILKLLLGGVYFLLVMVAAYIWDYSFEIYPFLLLIAFNHALSSLILFLRSNISALGFYWVDSMISVLDRLLLIIVCSILLWASPFDIPFQIEWFVYAQSSTLSFTALVAFLVVRRRITRLRFRFNPAFLMLILRESYPYALVVFLMTIYTRIDGVMIERMLPDGQLEADIYASAFRLLDASSMFGYLFSTLLLPMFSKMIKHGESVRSLVRFSFQLIWAGALTLTLTLIFFQEEIMVTLYDHGSAYSGQILSYLMLSFLAITGSIVYGTLLTANGNLMKLNVIFIVGVVMNILLNWWMIPYAKGLGAAQASCLTQFVVFLGQLLLAKQELSLRLVWSMVFQLAGFAVTLYLAMYVFVNFTFVKWPLQMGMSLVAGALLAFLFRLIDLRQFAELASKR